MKNLLLFVGLAATLISIPPSSSTLQLTSRNSTDKQLLRTIASDVENLDMSGVKLDETEWLAYKLQYAKNYPSREEDSIRGSIFAYNKHQVDKFNAEQSKRVCFEMGINHLSDLSSTEMEMRNGFRSLQAGDGPINSPEAEKFLTDLYEDDSIEIPDEIDWREVPGRVSRVKDQGDCASCWAFASTGALEGQEKVRVTNSSNELVELSEQNLVDCLFPLYDCKYGGRMDRAFNYVKEVGGIATESSYPYTSSNTEVSECRFSKDLVAFPIVDVANLPMGDEEALKIVVAKYGPVSVAIKTSEEFRLYKNGIFYGENCSGFPDHAVLVVGYGTDELCGDYWIVKNSWGLTFGNEGYIKMARNRGNNCGIATNASIPTF